MIINISTHYNQVVLSILDDLNMTSHSCKIANTILSNIVVALDDDEKYRDWASWGGDALGSGLIYAFRIDRN